MVMPIHNPNAVSVEACLKLTIFNGDGTFHAEDYIDCLVTMDRDSLVTAMTSSSGRPYPNCGRVTAERIRKILDGKWSDKTLVCSHRDEWISPFLLHPIE